MKQYKRPKEKKNLYSLFKETIVHSNECSRKIKTAPINGTRERDEFSTNQPGRSSEKNWFIEEKCEPNNKWKKDILFGLHFKNDRQHRSGSENDSEEKKD